MVNWSGGLGGYPTKFEKSVIRLKIRKIIKSFSISVRIWLADGRTIGSGGFSERIGFGGYLPTPRHDQTKIRHDITP